MDERDTCGRCGRDTSCFVIAEVFCFQIGKSLLIKRNLLIRCSLQFEMSKQNLHTRGCMLRSKRGEWKKDYTHCAKGKPLKWTCSVKNQMCKMHEAKSCLDKYWSAHRVVLEISGPLGKFCWIASQCFASRQLIDNLHLWQWPTHSMGAKSRIHVVLRGLQKWNRTTICKCQGWRLGAFSTKRKDDMYTKLQRGEMKAEFPLVSAEGGEEGCLFSARRE